MLKVTSVKYRRGLEGCHGRQWSKVMTLNLKLMPLRQGRRIHLKRHTSITICFPRRNNVVCAEQEDCV